MRQFWIGFLGCFLYVGVAFAAPQFPALSGRVVDGANMLSAPVQQQLSQLLADHEASTTNQVVVATVATLEGLPIEAYGVTLARQWQIGQKDKNNGVILLVAQQEHQVRIEVGYGLEGELTDALSRQIIEQVMVPQFREGHMEQGVADGVRAIVSVLGGAPIAALQEQPPLTMAEKIAIIISVLVFVILCIRYPLLAWWFLDGVVRAGGRGAGGGFGGGHFGGGGGGSFGGGGASGRW